MDFSLDVIKLMNINYVNRFQYPVLRVKEVGVILGRGQYISDIRAVMDSDQPSVLLLCFR